MTCRNVSYCVSACLVARAPQLLEVFSACPSPYLPRTAPGVRGNGTDSPRRPAASSGAESAIGRCPLDCPCLLEPCIRRTWTVNDAESMIVASTPPRSSRSEPSITSQSGGHFAQVEKPVSLLAGLESPTEDGLSEPPTLPVGASSGSPGRRMNRMDADAPTAICRCARGACTPASSRADAGLPPVPPGSGECAVLGSSSCLASSTQQMNSLRARGVMSFQASSCGGVGDQRIEQVRGKLVHHATGTRLAVHRAG